VFGAQVRCDLRQEGLGHLRGGVPEHRDFQQALRHPQESEVGPVVPVL
jgi:hypothetical protein